MKDAFITSIVVIATLAFVIFMSNVTFNEAILKRLKAGTIRVYDEEYKCEYVGKYINEEKFIPVVIDELPNAGKISIVMK